MLVGAYRNAMVYDVIGASRYATDGICVCYVRHLCWATGRFKVETTKNETLLKFHILRRQLT